MTAPSQETTPPDTAEVVRICAIGSRVVRNLAITDCYARLSGAVRARTGAGANWCTFATWASRQAGATIRGEDLLDRLRRRLGQRARLLAPIRSFKRWLLRKGLFQPDTRLGRVVAAIHTPFDALERASDAVARGNLKVFEEIGREFARYLHDVSLDAALDSQAFVSFTRGLKSGPPPDGQDLLRGAFAALQRQGQTADPETAALLLLLANLQMGLHEQTRLQPEIASSLDAPVTTAVDLGRRVLHALLPVSRRWPGVVVTPLASMAGWFARRVQAAGTSLVREVVTESLMVLSLPQRVLRLGEHLDAPAPPWFARGRLPDLDALVLEYDACGPGGIACGASDWCDLRQRMHYIVHLFRAFSGEPSLLQAPFTPAQVRGIHAGLVPDGDL